MKTKKLQSVKINILLITFVLTILLISFELSACAPPNVADNGITPADQDEQSENSMTEVGDVSDDQPQPSSSVTLNEGETLVEWSEREVYGEYRADKDAATETRITRIRTSVIRSPAIKYGSIMQLELLNEDGAVLEHIRKAGVGFVVLKPDIHDGKGENRMSQVVMFNMDINQERVNDIGEEYKMAELEVTVIDFTNYYSEKNTPGKAPQEEYKDHIYLRSAYPEIYAHQFIKFYKDRIGAPTEMRDDAAVMITLDNFINSLRHALVSKWEGCPIIAYSDIDEYKVTKADELLWAKEYFERIGNLKPTDFKKIMYSELYTD